MATSTISDVRVAPGRWLLFGGLGLAIIAILAYAAQFAAQRLFTPWYLPIATTLGAAMIGAALAKFRNVWRGLALAFVLLLGGAEWALMFVTRLPEYTGPVTVGKAFPTFTTMRADGTAFTQDEFRDGAKNVLVFFRGRW